MGQILTPTYRVEFSNVVAFDGKTAPRRIRVTPGCWRVRSTQNLTAHGHPSAAALRSYVRAAETVEPDGSFIRIGAARIVRQSNDETVAEYAAPMFAAV